MYSYELNTYANKHYEMVAGDEYKTRSLVSVPESKKYIPRVFGSCQCYVMATLFTPQHEIHEKFDVRTLLRCEANPTLECKSESENDL